MNTRDPYTTDESVKGQMAARYMERMSMGYEVPDGWRPSSDQYRRHNSDLGRTGDIPQSMSVIVPKPVKPYVRAGSSLMNNEAEAGNVYEGQMGAGETVDRSGMRELINKFEQRNADGVTKVGRKSPRSKPRTPAVDDRAHLKETTGSEVSFKQSDNQLNERDAKRKNSIPTQQTDNVESSEVNKVLARPLSTHLTLRTPSPVTPASAELINIFNTHKKKIGQAEQEVQTNTVTPKKGRATSLDQRQDSSRENVKDYHRVSPRVKSDLASKGAIGKRCGTSPLVGDESKYTVYRKIWNNKMPQKRQSKTQENSREVTPSGTPRRRKTPSLSRESSNLEKDQRTLTPSQTNKPLSRVKDVPSMESYRSNSTRQSATPFCYSTGKSLTPDQMYEVEKMVDGTQTRSHDASPTSQLMLTQMIEARKAAAREKRFHEVDLSESTMSYITKRLNARQDRPPSTDRFKANKPSKLPVNSEASSSGAISPGEEKFKSRRHASYSESRKQAAGCNQRKNKREVSSVSPTRNSTTRSNFDKTGRYLLKDADCLRLKQSSSTPTNKRQRKMSAREAIEMLLSKDEMANSELLPVHLRMSTNSSPVPDNKSSSDNESSCFSLDEREKALKANRMMKMFQGPLSPGAEPGEYVRTRELSPKEEKAILEGKVTPRRTPIDDQQPGSRNRTPIRQLVDEKLPASRNRTPRRTPIENQTLIRSASQLLTPSHDSKTIQYTSRGSAKLCSDTEESIPSMNPEQFKTAVGTRVATPGRVSSLDSSPRGDFETRGTPIPKYMTQDRRNQHSPLDPEALGDMPLREKLERMDYPMSKESLHGTPMNFESVNSAAYPYHFGVGLTGRATKDDIAESDDDKLFLSTTDPLPKRKRKLENKPKKIKKKKKRKKEDLDDSLIERTGTGRGTIALGSAQRRPTTVDKKKPKEPVQKQLNERLPPRRLGSRASTNDMTILKSEPLERINKMLYKSPRRNEPERIESSVISFGSPNRSPISPHNETSVWDHTFSQSLRRESSMHRKGKIIMKKLKPVAKLYPGPCPKWPIFSNIPLAFPDMYQRLLVISSHKRKVNQITKYRRWQEDLRGAEFTSKIPLSFSFRKTLCEASIIERELHSWVLGDREFSSLEDDDTTQGDKCFPVEECPSDILFRMEQFKFGPIRLCHALHIATSTCLSLLGYLSYQLYNCGGEEFDYFCSGDEVECATQYTQLELGEAYSF